MDKHDQRPSETKLDAVKRHGKEGERALESQRKSIDGRQRYGQPDGPADDESEPSQHHHLEHRAPPDRVGEHDPGAPDLWNGGKP